MDTPVIFAALPFQFRILAKKELVAYPIHRMVLESLRADSDRHRQSARHALQPGRRRQGSALRNAAVRLSRGRPNPRRRAAAISLRRGLSGHSRAGSPGAHRAQRSLRSAADSHPPFLSRRADPHRRRADRDHRHDSPPDRRTHRPAARRHSRNLAWNRRSQRSVKVML